MTENKKEHPFETATSLTGGPDIFKGETSLLYQNMIGPFGGVIAAVILKAAMIHPQCQGDPLSLTVNYAAPVKDGDFEISPVPVRTNRSTQHWYLSLSQENEVAVSALLITAKRRETWSSLEIDMPDEPDPSELFSLSSKDLPEWFNRYDIRPVKGSLPPFFEIEGEEPFQEAESIHWICNKPELSLSFLSLAAFADSFAPRIFIRRNKFVPAGTVSFTVYFHVSRNELDKIGGSHVLGHARANILKNNYCDQTGEIWSPNGQLLATTSQVAYFKE
jgi:acyl-CoA thioesterase